MYTNNTNHTNKTRASFTLIELLVVLALVAILSVVVVMTLNPAELLKQARDSNRLSDLATINTSLNLFASDVVGGFMGTSSIIYTSLADTNSTCANLGLPALPPGWVYNCVNSTNLRKTNGTGWIPVNLERISSGSPLSQLPIDPQNTSSTKYYTYTTGGSWKLTAAPESQKYLSTATSDGGIGIGQFEVGNNIELSPFTDGLVGWWKFDEESGTTANDSSGFGNSGTLYNSPVWTTGKIGNALTFNNTNTYILLATSTPLRTRAKTVLFWANPVSTKTYNMILGTPGANYYVAFSLTNKMFASYINNNSAQIANVIADGVVATGVWSHYAFVFDVNGSNVTVSAYKNGSLVGSVSRTDGYTSAAITSAFYLGAYAPSDNIFNGSLDDIRAYNRALSATEVLAIYNATK